MEDKVFKVGDRVEVIRNYHFDPINCGRVGRVCSVEVLGSTIGVTFKNWRRGHDCQNKAETEFSGWNYLPRQLELTNKDVTDFNNEPSRWGCTYNAT